MSPELYHSHIKFSRKSQYPIYDKKTEQTSKEMVCSVSDPRVNSSNPRIACNTYMGTCTYVASAAFPSSSSCSAKFARRVLKADLSLTLQTSGEKDIPQHRSYLSAREAFIYRAARTNGFASMRARAQLLLLFNFSKGQVIPLRIGMIFRQSV